MTARVRAKGRRPTAPAFAPGHPLWFPARFLGIWLIGIVALSAWPGVERWAIGATVESLRLVLLTLGASASASDSMIRAGGISFQIVSDCTPLMPTVLLVSAILAFPAKWKWKALGITAGAAALWAYNLLRVLALFVVKGRWPQAFDFIHVYVWQSATLLVVFLLFLGWMAAPARWARIRSHPPRPEAAAEIRATPAGGE